MGTHVKMASNQKIHFCPKISFHGQYGRKVEQTVYTDLLFDLKVQHTELKY